MLELFNGWHQSHERQPWLALGAITDSLGQHRQGQRQLMWTTSTGHASMWTNLHHLGVSEMGGWVGGQARPQNTPSQNITYHTGMKIFTLPACYEWQKCNNTYSSIVCITRLSSLGQSVVHHFSGKKWLVQSCSKMPYSKHSFPFQREWIYLERWQVLNIAHPLSIAFWAWTHHCTIACPRGVDSLLEILCWIGGMRGVELFTSAGSKTRNDGNQKKAMFSRKGDW